MKDFLFVDLAALTSGKPFAGFAAGSFVDMNGRPVEFKPEHIKEFLSNTLNAIKASMAKGMPGLPIDARQHDKGEAAGWIVDAFEGSVTDSLGKIIPVIMLAAQWTSLGLTLIQEKLLANFSPTVDLKNSTILGGSLTNWPASVDRLGAPLFPAVELSRGIYHLEASLNDTINRVCQAWCDEHGDYETHVLEVFEEYIVVCMGSAKYKIGYSLGDGMSVTFAPREDWAEVTQEWVEAQRELEQSAIELPSEKESELQGDIDMTREELSQIIAEEVKGAFNSSLRDLAAPRQESNGDSSEEKSSLEFDVIRFLDMESTSDEVQKAYRQRMLEEYEMMQRQAAIQAAEMISRIRKETEIAEFAQATTSGTPEVPYGLSVNAEDLKEFLNRLAPADYQFAKDLLTNLRTYGRTSFAELGHGKRKQPLIQIPPDLDPVLRHHVNAGGSIEGFFSRAGIGSADDYDLSAYSVKEK